MTNALSVPELCGTDTLACAKCKFTILKEQHGKQLSDSQIGELLTKRRTKIIKGFKKKHSSGSYDARLVLGDDFKVRLEFDNDSKPAKPA